MVVVLDDYSVHRARGLELKDGHPLNEARMLRNSIVDNKNQMAADQTIKYNAAKSVLKYKIGDAIRLNEEHFVALSKAFFAEIEAKFS